MTNRILSHICFTAIKDGAMPRSLLFPLCVFLSLAMTEPSAAQDEEIEQWASIAVGSSSGSNTTFAAIEDVTISLPPDWRANRCSMTGFQVWTTLITFKSIAPSHFSRLVSWHKPLKPPPPALAKQISTC